MGFILKLLGGSFGPYLIGGVGALLSLTLLFAGMQTARLKHAKADLKEARAALYAPGPDGKPSRQTWKVKAEAATRDFETCKANTTTLQTAIDLQNASLTSAAKEGRLRTAQADKAIQAARTATQRAEAKGRAVLNHEPVGGDVCSRVLDVDRQFLGELR